jgi:serine/alanine adding enzyme
MLTTRLAGEDDARSWDRFVLAHKEGSFYHLFSWGKVLESAGVGKRLYFFIENGKRILGIFPSLLIHKPVRNIRSLPLSDCGPLISYGGNTSRVLSSLLKSIGREGIKNLCPYLSLRVFSYSRLNKMIPKNYEIRLSSYGIRLDTHSGDRDLIWKQMLSKKRRNSIRKALTFDLDIRLGDTTRDFSAFYELHEETMRRRNAPLINFEVFESIRKNLCHERDYLIMLAKLGRERIAGVLALLFKDGMYLWSSVSRTEYLHLNPNDLLYWNLIEYACERGYKFIDFGPSPADKSGTYLFKIQFGGIPHAIYDCFYSPFPYLLTLGKLFMRIIRE